jgi:histone H3/H4
MPFKVVKKYQKELNKAFQHPTIKRILRKVNNIEIDAAIAR